MIVQSILAAIIPALVYIYLIYYVDRYEKEPLWLLTAAFLWGAVPAIIGALLFNVVLGAPFYMVLGQETGDAAVATFVAPLVEESVKGLALLLILFLWRDQIDTLLDGIIYGAMVGIGFAMVENVFYFVDEFQASGVEGWQTLVILRAVLFGLNHSLFTSMTGMGVAVAKLNPRSGWRWAAPVLGWSAAVFIHFLHNTFASASEIIGPLACIPLFGNAWGGVLITAVIVGWSVWQERQWIQKYLAEEVQLGTLTAVQYRTASSTGQRFVTRWQLLFRGGPQGFWQAQRFYFTCSKLAYAKHQYGRTPDEVRLAQVAALRLAAAELGRGVG